MSVSFGLYSLETSIYKGCLNKIANAVLELKYSIKCKVSSEMASLDSIIDTLPDGDMKTKNTRQRKQADLRLFNLEKRPADYGFANRRLYFHPTQLNINRLAAIYIFSLRSADGCMSLITCLLFDIPVKVNKIKRTEKLPKKVKNSFNEPTVSVSG